MNIKINRTITTRLYTMGELFINGSKTTLTVEDTLTMLEPGIYRVRLIKGSSRRFEIAILPDAFAYCSSLTDIYCYATTPPICHDYDTFYRVSKYCYIHVPAGTISNYQVATGWRYFSNFLEISEETAISETEQQNKSSRKIIRDGQVLILRSGVTYDMMGNTL